MRRLCTDRLRSYPGRPVCLRRQVGRVSAITWEPEAPGVETSTVSKQESAEGIVGLLTEGPNEEVRRGHL
jgi:hypothetical protein